MNSKCKRIPHTHKGVSLLDEWIIRVESRGAGVRELTLPGVLALLCSDNDPYTYFPGLRPHQQMPWHAFLVQLAAIALNRAGSGHADDLPTTEGVWQELLSELVEDPEAYSLLPTSPDHPGILQPLIPSDEVKQFPTTWSVRRTPDEIDVPVGSRNHVVKAGVAYDAHPDQWLYALVTVQTTGGYPGRGHYGVVRMNGGYGSRPFVTRKPSYSVGECFRRDLRVLLYTREDIAGEFSYPTLTGKSLLWTVPWDGKDQLTLTDLDPCFIEICRRIRLVREDGRIVAYVRPTETRRIADAGTKGNVGDPWAPITEEGAMLTVGESGWNYRTLGKLLSGEGIRPSLMQRPSPWDGNRPTLHMSVLARGRGTTAGYHERYVSLTGGADGSVPEKATLIAEVSVKALRPALSRLSGGQREVTDKWVAEAEREVSREFATVMDMGEGELREWLKGWAERAVVRCSERCAGSVAAGGRNRELAEAGNILGGCLRKVFGGGVV